MHADFCMNKEPHALNVIMPDLKPPLEKSGCESVVFAIIIKID